MCISFPLQIALVWQSEQQFQWKCVEMADSEQNIFLYHTCTEAVKPINLRGPASVSSWIWNWQTAICFGRISAFNHQNVHKVIPWLEFTFFHLQILDMLIHNRDSCVPVGDEWKGFTCSNTADVNTSQTFRRTFAFQLLFLNFFIVINIAHY